ncbi:putative dienelactone hydrolase, alpha/Beta hydrolase [Helianthus annuus]|uniref:Dienelactone hydrolase, alpha/Beta hydrolase n=1 Tax=Helianthus annuus TaxID=4232 RepID=A0A251UCW0_HELAN|nr:endo-1,3;1,4-beta-D-glucanase [Helianthus annuus]KAF5799686.1 putative dienelactone hydrolase, alpha/Beta hydrolase [Helianthus annuus]
MSGPQCCTNPPDISSGSRQDDHLEVIGGLTSYTAGSPASKLAVILLSDIYGYEAPKLRQIAEKVAAAGFYVVVPDFFYGDPYLPDMEISSWFPNHLPAKGCEDARKLVADLKAKGASAVGAAGFCWGGITVSKMSAYGEIEAAVILHPGPLSEDDIHATKVPTAILGAEFDDHAPPEQMKKLGEILSAKPVDNFVKIYPGVVHGWSTRYRDDDEHAVKSAMEAHTDMLNWFTKYLK